MGRRKIEIKAIKDDRNRSVTFLKRKGGLFKKAHELSVLCSVDVAVIIFGHNKKLYEYSSGDISETLGRYQYYGQPHEHKGPADFSGKRGEADDDDDDDISPPPEEIVPPTHSMVPPHMQNQSGFQHINHAPSASPPMHNGLPNGLPFHRHSTPQPSQGASRPSSRNNIRRSSSTLISQQNQHPPQAQAHATPPPPPPPQQNGYAYAQNHTMYNGQANSNMSQHPPPAPAHYPQYAPQGQQHPQQQQQQQQQALPQAPPQHYQPRQHAPQQHPAHQQVPQVQQQQQQSQQYVQQDQRRQSVPPAVSQQQERAIPAPESSPPQQQYQQPPPKQEDRQSPPPPKPLPVKSRSIFTPIDDRGSVLAQHFGFGPPTSDASRNNNTSFKEESTEESAAKPTSGPPPPPAPVRSVTHPQRTQSTSSVPEIAPPSRSNSAQVGVGRPRLKVQIPSENSDGGSATADSSPRDSAANKATTPAKGNSESGRVLPPPSPSASALMSAGAQGPPNPFARPPPATGPPNTASYNANNNIDTPVSALPSRFMADGLLPSPSSFYPEWGFGRSGPDSNLLPSPLTFPTPTMQTGPGFSKESEDSEKKRKSPEAGSSNVEGVGPGKRLKT